MSGIFSLEEELGLDSKQLVYSPVSIIYSCWASDRLDVYFIILWMWVLRGNFIFWHSFLKTDSTVIQDNELGPEALQMFCSASKCIHWNLTSSIIVLLTEIPLQRKCSIKFRIYHGFAGCFQNKLLFYLRTHVTFPRGLPVTVFT